MGLYLGTTPITLGAGPLRWFYTNNPITVTAGATAHTKGAWTQIVLSTSDDATMLILGLQGIAAAATDTSMLVDVATGAAGAETPIVENIAVGGAGGSLGQTYSIPLPYAVPAGTRLSVRAQAAVGGDTVAVKISLLSGGMISPATSPLTVLGTSTATSAGTAVTGGEGVWNQVIASTAAAYRYLILVPSLSSTDSAAHTGYLALATGAGGAEAEINRVGVVVSSSEYVSSIAAGTDWAVSALSVGVAAETRLSASSGSADMSCCVIGVP